MEFDDKTGFYFSNVAEKTNVNKEISESQGSSFPHEEKVSPDTIIESTETNPLNKKMIFIVAGILLAISLIYAFVKTSDLLPKKNKKEDLKVASDISVPGYLVNENREGKVKNENTTIDESLPNYTMSETVKVETVSTKTNVSEKSSSTNTPKIQTNAGASERELAARSAPLLVSGSNLSGASKTSTASSVYSSSSSYLSSISGMSESQYIQNSLANLGLTGSSSTNNSSYKEQNMQEDKQSFYNQNKNNITTGYYIGEDTIFQGTVLNVVLDTAISTDMPGEIRAHFAENVYDSLTGQTLLIPVGTTVIATYNSSVSYSQKRIQIAWNTLIRPDGYTLDLGNMNGIDSEGMSGVKGRVDDHLWEYAKAMGIITFFTAINGEFSYTAKNLGANTEYAQNIISANQSAVNQLGNKLIDRAMDIQPTIIKGSGKTVKIFVNKNVSLPPLETPPVTQKYVRK